MRWWAVWGRVFKKFGEELAKMKVSFSKGETLKRDNVRVEDDRLILFSFHFSFLFLFSIYLLFLNLELGVNLVLYVTVIKCHTSVTCHKKYHRKF